MAANTSWEVWSKLILLTTTYLIEAQKVGLNLAKPNRTKLSRDNPCSWDEEIHAYTNAIDPVLE